MISLFHTEKGFIALITVLVITAIAVGVSTSSALSGVSASQLVIKQVRSAQALSLADACGEEALLRLKNNFNYAAGLRETVSFGTEGSCDIVSVIGVVEKEIRAEASADNEIRRIKIFATKPGSSLVIDSWQEVADF